MTTLGNLKFVKVGSGFLVYTRTELFNRPRLFFIPSVRQPLEEEQGEDKVAKVRRVNRTSEDCRRIP